MLVSLVLTGMVPFTDLNVSNPVSFAIQLAGQDWVAGIISLGAVTGMMTVILVMLYGGSRLLYAIARDGLLPKFMTKLNSKHYTPVNNTWIFASAVAICAGFIPLDKLAELVNMGTLIAFIVVSIGVIYLRKDKSLPEGGFKVPLFPLIPIVSFLSCIFLITQLSPHTWVSSGIWFVIGIIIYLLYGRKHSTLNK